MTKNKKEIPSKEEIKEYESLSEEEINRRMKEVYAVILQGFDKILEKDEWDEKIMFLLERVGIITIG